MLGSILNKKAIVEKIIEALKAELQNYEHSAREARAGATDPQSKAENKYDTRGLESSYLAMGQSRQIIEVMQALQKFETLPLRVFNKRDPIDIGALVTVEQKNGRSVYFVGPLAGGTEVECDNEEVLVITPQSPLGQQLTGLRRGEKFQMLLGKTRESFTVTSVE
jgi:transcription elongation GreA/GreB family factor